MNKSLKNKKQTLRIMTLVGMFLCVFYCSRSQANNETISTNTMDSSLDLYLLIGQSNMAGRGIITEKFKEEGNPNVIMLSKENKWVPAKNPLHFDKPTIVGVGPGLSFGIAMEKSNSTHKIGLIPCAVGGTSIDVWKPGAFDKDTKTHPSIKRFAHSGSLYSHSFLERPER